MAKAAKQDEAKPAGGAHEWVKISALGPAPHQVAGFWFSTPGRLMQLSDYTAEQFAEIQADPAVKVEKAAIGRTAA